MIGRILGAYQSEIDKALRNTLPYIGAALMLAMIGVAALIRPLAVDSESDYDFLAFAVQLSLNVLGFLIVLLFSSSLVSPELASGSIRIMLVRPLRRSELIAAKILTGMTYALVLNLLALGTAWIVAAWWGELIGVYYGAELLHGDQEMAGAYAAAAGLALLPQFAGVALGVFLSACTKNTAAAITSAIGIWWVLDAIKYPLRIERYVFTTYLERPWMLFADMANGIPVDWTPVVIRAVAVSLITWAVFSILAAMLLSRRDLS